MAQTEQLSLEAYLEAFKKSSLKELSDLKELLDRGLREDPENFNPFLNIAEIAKVSTIAELLPVFDKFASHLRNLGQQADVQNSEKSNAPRKAKAPVI